jgi:hypothetical protein
MMTPTSEMTSLNVVVTFAPTIHDFVATSGLEVGNNFRIAAAPRVADPCNFPDKPAVQNQWLTSSTSTDGHQIIIKGSNVTLYESQSFIASFYPGSGREYPNKDIQISGEASYEAFGHDLPARILLVSFDESGKPTLRDLKRSQVLGASRRRSQATAGGRGTLVFCTPKHVAHSGVEVADVVLGVLVLVEDLDCGVLAWVDLEFRRQGLETCSENCANQVQRAGWERPFSATCI